MTSDRTVKIGKTTVVITNVPDNITEDELKSMALMKLFEMNKAKAVKEMQGYGKAS